MTVTAARHRGPAPITFATSWLAVVGIATAIAVYTAWWWSAYRTGMPWFIDEAGYLSFAYDHAAAIRDGGLQAMSTHRIDGPYGPLVPSLTGALLLPVDDPYRAAMVTMIVSGAALTASTWFLARQVVHGWWPLACALAVAAAPSVLVLTGTYYFAVPASALFTFALACFFRSEFGAKRWWTVAGGAALAAATLARTMVLGLVPAVVVAVVAVGFVHLPHRRQRTINLVLAGAVALVVMVPWWIPNVSAVLDYLDQPSRVGGLHRGQQGGGAWRTPGVRDLRLLAADLLLPMLALVVAALGTTTVVWWRRGRPVLDRPRHAALLIVVVLSGVALLFAGEAVGQWIPVLPALIVLASSGSSRLSPSAQRVTLGVLLAVVLFNVTQSSRVLPDVSRPRMVQLGPFGRLPLTDARWPLEDQIRPGRLDSGGVLPDEYEVVQRDIDEVVTIAAEHAASADEPGVLVLPRSAHPLLNVNVMLLADRMVHLKPRLIVGGIAIPPDTGAEAVRALLEDPQNGQPNLILSVEPELDSTLAALGFDAIDRIELPGDLNAVLWWRPRAAIHPAMGTAG